MNVNLRRVFQSLLELYFLRIIEMEMSLGRQMLSTAQGIFLLAFYLFIFH